MYCINGECLNTDGSYHCFCSLPLVLDATGNRCVNLSIRAGEPEPPPQHTFTPRIPCFGWVSQEGARCRAEGCQCQHGVQPGQGGRSWGTGSFLSGQGGWHSSGLFLWHPLLMALTDALEEYEIHLDVCWQTVADYICQDLLHGEQTTYTECCCRLGEAWGQNCALCPHRSSGEQGGVGKHPLAEVGASWAAAGHARQGWLCMAAVRAPLVVCIAKASPRSE